MTKSNSHKGAIRMEQQFIKEAADLSFAALVNLLQEAETVTGTSLFQYTRRTVVNSRVFIDDTLRGEDILTPLMMNMMNLYAGLIMTAVNLNQRITSTKTVRDSLSIVATEDYEVEFADELMDTYFKGCNMRATMAKNNKPQRNQNNKPNNKQNIPNKANTNGTRRNNNSNNNSRGSGSLGSTGVAESQYVTRDFENEVPLPSGRIIQVTFDTRETGKFTVNILLQLSPTYVPTDVSQQFIAIHFKPSIAQRWLQMTAGEISFFTDFLLGNDLRRKRLDALRKDKSGVLSEMIDRRENAVSNMWLKLSKIKPDRQNIANTILIYESRNFDKACSVNGIDFKNYANRQKFFSSTMSMIVAVVNVMYNRIDMYFNGMQNYSTFTFDQMKKNAKTEATDILAMMKQYANNGMIKF